jgi:cytolysin-activating lysine-acyltransferase
MRPHDWKSGDHLWVVEIIAPFGGADLMVQDLKQNVFPTREMRFLAVTAAGKEVRVVSWFFFATHFAYSVRI